MPKWKCDSCEHICTCECKKGTELEGCGGPSRCCFVDIPAKWVKVK